MAGHTAYTHRSTTPHLPTRCPACKGGLIQRMPKPSYSEFISFHCLFCKNIWKIPVDDAVLNPVGEVTGDVFIVTKRRMKQKLASVVVRAIPESVLKKHLDSRTMQGELERRKLQRDIDRLSANLRLLQVDEDRLWKNLKRDQNDTRKAEAWSAAYNKCKDISKRLGDLLAQRQHLTSGEYFLADLPSGVASATTDAEGRFRLALPRRGRYGLIALASRELFKGKEALFWLVWVTLDGQASKHLLLNNENMVRATGQAAE